MLKKKRLEVFENKGTKRISDPEGGTEHEFGVPVK